MMLTSPARCEVPVNSAQLAAQLTKPIKPSQLYDALIGVFGGRPARVRARVGRPAFDPQMGQRHPLRILLAEDNVVNQKVAVRILERMGYRADVVDNRTMWC